MVQDGCEGLQQYNNSNTLPQKKKKKLNTFNFLNK